jgi:hypothetical protein
MTGPSGSKWHSLSAVSIAPHRSPTYQSPLAELTQLTVPHHDKDFDLIAGITRQPVEWLTAT